MSYWKALIVSGSWVFERFEPALRHRERIVAEDDLLGVLVPLVHRKVGDPAEAKGILLDEVELLAELGPELPRQWVGNVAPVAYEEDGSRPISPR